MAGKLGKNEHETEVEESLEPQQTAEGEVEPLLWRSEPGGNDNHRDWAGEQAPYPCQDAERHGPVKAEKPEDAFYDSAQLMLPYLLQETCSNNQEFEVSPPAHKPASFLSHRHASSTIVLRPS